MATRSAVAGSTFSSWANSRTLRRTKWRGFSSTGRNSSWRLGLSKPKVLARSGRWFCEPSEFRFLGMWLHFYRINRGGVKRSQHQMHTIAEYLTWSETFVALGTTNRGTCEIGLTRRTNALKVLQHYRGCCRASLVADKCWPVQ